jgi:hypothetical protein
MKRFILAAMALTAGLFLAPSPAAADSGFINTTATIGDSDYNIHAISGNGTDWHVVVNSVNPAGSHNIWEVQVEFLKSPTSGAPADHLLINGATGTGGVVGVGAGAWHPTTVPSGVSANTFRFVDPTYNVVTTNGLHKILANGSNQFVADMNLAPAGITSTDVKGLRITLKNGAGVTCEVNGLVPEPGAIALLLPGLAPLGFVLRRRFSLGSGGAEEELTETL